MLIQLRIQIRGAKVQLSHEPRAGLITIAPIKYVYETQRKHVLKTVPTS